MKRISTRVRARILCWTQHHLLNEEFSADPNDFQIALFAGCRRREAFLFIDGADYYVFGKRAGGKTEIELRALRSLQDLPAMLPEEVPIDVYERLEKRTRLKKGWIRQSR